VAVDLGGLTHQAENNDSTEKGSKAMRRNASVSWFCALFGAVLIASSVYADELSSRERYVTLAYTGDTVTLNADETAIIVSAYEISGGYYYLQSIDYRRGTNSFVSISVPLQWGDGGSVAPLPLVGPGVVAMNDPAPVGVVALKIVKTKGVSLTRSP
jgi:hypothetical protein